MSAVHVAVPCQAPPLLPPLGPAGKGLTVDVAANDTPLWRAKRRTPRLRGESNPSHRVRSCLTVPSLQRPSQSDGHKEALPPVPSLRRAAGLLSDGLPENPVR